MKAARDEEKAKDAAILLPLAAAALLLPPVILIFAAPLLVGGVPLIVAYLFSVWAAIILATALLARRLAAHERADDPDEAQGFERPE